MNYRDDDSRRAQQGGQGSWSSDADDEYQGGRGQQHAFQGRTGQQGGRERYGRGTGGSDFGGSEAQYRDDQSRLMGDDRGTGYQRGSGYEGRGGYEGGGRGYEGRDSWRTHDTDRFGGPGQIPRTGVAGHSMRAFDHDAQSSAWESTPGAGRYERHEQGGGMGDMTSGRERGRHWDPDYHQWREEQIRRLDDDYDAYRKERYGKFSEEFDSWRSNRAKQGSSNSAVTGSGTSKTAATSSGSANGASSGKSDEPKQKG